MKQIGGSAALEGVMMKASDAWALAVRLPDGSIHVERHEETALAQRFAWARWPLVRGVVALFDALSVSYRALSRSAQLVGEEEEELSRGALYATMAVSTLIGIALFILLPAGISRVFVDAAAHPVLFNALAGVFKALILVGYLVMIGRLPDIQRFFMYHGAEHKAIAAYEAGLELTVENVRAQPAYHPRCGTTFIAFVILSSIVVYSLLPRPDVLWWLFLGRVALLPVVAGVAFELLRFSATHTDPISRALRWIGYRFQMLTVKEPTDDMIEVAIESTKAAVAARAKAVAVA
ncbi:DUF1385 domain-containing protein [Marinithermus hydrothermalis]|uniref:Metal-dependent enzyme n=1 Tax=Marinithermus hydrothermalis (strain DSM 14884 / JCM 11576 / T1) TaxID=869210 RepID=F2NNU8_MARHT|nr:DUF1385 domain-containing protein [Marinithermus hydrothermalis]AEB11322.1 protein of unknown function DUF1385 [Marinithermus hydrothermalis DSM 14884]